MTMIQLFSCFYVADLDEYGDGHNDDGDADDEDDDHAIDMSDDDDDTTETDYNGDDEYYHLRPAVVGLGQVVKMWTGMVMLMTMVMMKMLTITCDPRQQALVKDDDGVDHGDDEDDHLCSAIVGLGQRVKLLLASCVPEHQAHLGKSFQQSAMTFHY